MWKFLHCPSQEPYRCGLTFNDYLDKANNLTTDQKTKVKR
jgi:hypothetical protein